MKKEKEVKYMDNNFEIAVKVELLKRKKTMRSLADEIGISYAYLTDIVKGNRKANHYRELIMEILNLKNTI